MTHDSNLTGLDESDSFECHLRQVARLDSQPVAASLPFEVGALLAGKYHVHEELGRGGMGVVFRATHAVSGRQVALKWLPPNAGGVMARREARAVGRIKHPNVVDVYDIEAHEAGHYLVMELLTGRSLAARIRDGKLSPSELLAIMVPTLRGVAEAHAQGVIHRDLKPDNVFLCQGPEGAPREPKVLDFGISKLRTDEEPSETLSHAGTGPGTLHYMSPEQLAGAASVDERTDIYAAGVMMYEALTGQVPFRAQSYSAQVLAIAGRKPVAIRTLEPGVPAALERIVLRAMAKRPEDRHLSVAALLDDLTRIARHCAAGERVHGAREALRSTFASRVSWVGLGLAAAAVLMAAGIGGAHSEQLSAGAHQPLASERALATEPVVHHALPKQPAHREPPSSVEPVATRAHEHAQTDASSAGKLAPARHVRVKHPPASYAVPEVPVPARAGTIRESDL